MRTDRRLVAGVLAIAIGACAPAPAPSAPPAPSEAVVAPVELLRYTCGSFPFPAERLTGAGGDELAATPLAAALREHLARPDMDIEWLPDAGWILVGQDATHAELVADNGDQGLAMVSLSNEGGGAWRVSGWGGCQPARVLPPGVNEAEWVLADRDAIDPTTTRFEALVTERECASGQSSEGRIIGPDILPAGDTMLITFAVRPLPGDAFTCQGNPPTRVTVVLPEPLGDRRLLDGSTLPPREPLPEP